MVNTKNVYAQSETGHGMPVHYESSSKTTYYQQFQCYFDEITLLINTNKKDKRRGGWWGGKETYALIATNLKTNNIKDYLSKSVFYLKP